jgi:ribosome biogenesis protein MAK21
VLKYECVQGDTEGAIASKASHHILQLLQSHPMMKSIVVREVASLVLRPTPKRPLASAEAAGEKGETAASDRRDHSRYYGIITLNQIILTRKEVDVANRLVDVYFEVFNDILHIESGKDDVLEEVAPVSRDERKRKRGKGGKDKKGKEKSAAEDASTDAVSGVEAESKMLPAVLTGVNRAFPFAQIDEDA